MTFDSDRPGCAPEECGGVSYDPATDEGVVAYEIARLRAMATETDPLPGLRADLLEAAPPALAARFLRECAIRALGSISDRHGEWVVSAILRADVYYEQRRIRLAGCLPVDLAAPSA